MVLLVVATWLVWCCYGVASLGGCYGAMVLLGVAMELLGVARWLLGGCYGVARCFWWSF